MAAEAASRKQLLPNQLKAQGAGNSDYFSSNIHGGNELA